MLAKVRMPIGRIGIFMNRKENSTCIALVSAVAMTIILYHHRRGSRDGGQADNGKLDTPRISLGEAKVSLYMRMYTRIFF